jgi:hypothetical protein
VWAALATRVVGADDSVVRFEAVSPGLSPGFDVSVAIAALLLMVLALRRRD